MFVIYFENLNNLRPLRKGPLEVKLRHEKQPCAQAEARDGVSRKVQH